MADVGYFYPTENELLNIVASEPVPATAEPIIENDDVDELTP